MIDKAQTDPVGVRVNTYVAAEEQPFLHESMIMTAELTKVEHPRITREKETIKFMVGIYCKAKHETHGELCPECVEFLTYAHMRLDKCPFQEKKSTCGKCLVHCYRPDMKEKVKKVMRFSGPRMLLHHPGLALHHVWDGRTKPPKLEKRRSST
jgi:hypothetical protein